VGLQQGGWIGPHTGEAGLELLQGAGGTHRGGKLAALVAGEATG
jgi:hypothetical protein